VELRWGVQLWPGRCVAATRTVLSVHAFLAALFTAAATLANDTSEFSGIAPVTAPASDLAIAKTGPVSTTPGAMLARVSCTGPR
jgi:hypothetical protein